MRLHGHFASAVGWTPLVNPSLAPVAYLHLDMLVLAPGTSDNFETGGFELCLVLLSGECAVRVDGSATGRLGGRESVFDGRASALYAPPGSHIEITSSRGRTELAVCRCRATARHPVRLVRPEDVVARKVGGPGYTRYVHDVLGTQVTAARMIVGETYTPQGNWSSFPPHKHDLETPPDEVRQEEVYLYRLRPQEGFGLQYRYSKADSARGALDEAVAVRENDFTVMPFGYHPVAAPPGYDVYYLWFLAGETRVMHPHDDPAYAWIKTDSLEARTYPE